MLEGRSYLPLISLQPTSRLEYVRAAILAQWSGTSNGLLLPDHERAVHRIIDRYQPILVYAGKAALIGGRIKGAGTTLCQIIAARLACNNVDISDPDHFSFRMIGDRHRPLLDVALDALKLDEMFTRQHEESIFERRISVSFLVVQSTLPQDIVSATAMHADIECLSE